MAMQRDKSGRPKQAKPGPGGGPARPKFKVPKIEITSKIVTQMGGTIACSLVAVLLLYLSVVRGCTGYHVRQAYQSYDATLTTPALEHLESALWWNSGHKGARVLRAKILCDDGTAGKLEEAKRGYLTLERDGFREPQVYAGLGVVYLKQADQAPVAEADPLIEKAKEAFNNAGGIPESHIGLGHCDLIKARKKNDAAFLAAARTKFLAVREIMEKDAEFRAQCTRDGLIDYYSGMGKALALGGAFDPASVKALKACSQLSGRWIMPKANLLRLEAVRLGAVQMELGETKKAKEDGLLLLNKARSTGVSGRGDKEIMEEARLVYTLSLASALGRAGDYRGYEELRVRAASGAPNKLGPFLFDAVYKTEQVEKGHPDTIQMGKLVGGAARAYRAILPKLNVDDAAQKDLRARVLNNAAWMDIWKGDLRKGVVRYYREGHARLMEAVRLSPNDYVINRNLVVVSLRMKHKPEVYGPYLVKARAAAQGGWAADFAEVERSLASD